jgi:regulator of protease activity HflC (stomatin/prohibitin superfamily)
MATTEIPLRRINGYAAIAVIVAAGVVGLLLIVAGSPDDENGQQTGGSGALIALGVVAVVLALVSLRGLIVVQPNQSKVVTLFGRYRGTVRESGFH